MIKVAEHKAQSHQALNAKDSELCGWIAKYHEVFSNQLIIFIFFYFRQTANLRSLKTKR